MSHGYLAITKKSNPKVKHDDNTINPTKDAIMRGEDQGVAIPKHRRPLPAITVDLVDHAACDHIITKIDSKAAIQYQIKVINSTSLSIRLMIK